MAAKPPPISPSKSASRSTTFDGNGNGVSNEILLRLPEDEYNQLFPKLEFVRLKLHTLLHEAGEPIKSAYL